jgi:hypothetical protein
LREAAAFWSNPIRSGSKIIAAYARCRPRVSLPPCPGAPELIALHGSMIYVLLALVMVLLVLRGIVKSL